MTRNPIVNALGAVFYISLVASVLYYGKSFTSSIEDTVLMPIAMLSLFSLSAAMMVFIFFYQPVVMYLEGKNAGAVKLALQTLASFAAITVILFVSLLSLSFF